MNGIEMLNQMSYESTVGNESGSFDYHNDKHLLKAVKNTLKIIKMLKDDECYKLIEDTINGFTNRESLVQYLINPLNVYFKPNSEPSGEILNEIKDAEGIIVSERVYHPYKHKVDGKYPVLSRKTMCIYPTYVRKNQQISAKETKSATSTGSADMLGQASGSDKVGTFSDPEVTVCLQHNCFNVVKEMWGAASSDVLMKQDMKAQLITTGEASMKDMPNTDEGKRGKQFLDAMLKTGAIDSDLIKQPL